MLCKKKSIHLQNIPSLIKNSSIKSRTVVKLEEKFALELGGELPQLEITYEELGKGDHIVIIFPSFSMGSHVCSSAADPTPGWWEGMVGPNKAIDTNKFRVICASILGAPFGTTSPISIDPKTNKIYGPRFPTITTNDQARVHIKLLDYLGVKSVHAAIGSSLGGMQVLNFAAEMENKLDRFVALCCTGKSSPGTVALRRVQRLAIASDLEFKNGDYEKGKGHFRDWL